MSCKYTFLKTTILSHKYFTDKDGALLRGGIGQPIHNKQLILGGGLPNYLVPYTEAGGEAGIEIIGTDGISFDIGFLEGFIYGTYRMGLC